MFRIQGCSKAVLTFSLAHFGLKMQKAERHNLYRRLKQLEQYKKQNQSYCVPDVDCQYCTEHTVPTKLCSKRCHAVATASLATITSVVIPCESEKMFPYHIIIKSIKEKINKSYLRHCSAKTHVLQWCEYRLFESENVACKPRIMDPQCCSWAKAADEGHATSLCPVLWKSWSLKSSNLDDSITGLYSCHFM